ncbi:phage tail tube protein [Paraburkholderia adhaesiva]|uniref:phage tail tube protein n=1 Tax=Paraburkholderia adhaesiva TaxID=2883244 RepID=UPI001F29011A|nr:hypothetical protein [Paraburkholderia adhaesiva]
MAKRAISAQRTHMYLEAGSDRPAAATGLIRSISKSQPTAVVLDDVSKLKNGNAIYILGTGFASIDNKTWVVQSIDEQTKSCILANSDTSRETGEFSNNGAWILHALIDLCVVSYALNQNEAATIDTTTLCDDERTSLVGFGDPGTFTFEFFIDPTDPDYLDLMEAQRNGDTRMLEIHYRNGAVRTLPVIVQAVNESGGVDQAIQGSVTMRVAGPSVLTQPVTGGEVPHYVLIAVIAPSSGNIPLNVVMTINEVGAQASKFVIDWKDGSAPQTITTHQALHTYTVAGQYRPTLVATIAGNETAPFNAQTIVTAQRPPYTLVATVTPTTGAAPLNVTMTLAETNGPAEEFEINWDDGTPLDTITALTATHQYVSQGIRNPTVIATLDGERQPFVNATPVVVSRPPYSVAIHIAPTSGTPPAQVTMTITETNGPADSFIINWGDGTADETTPAPVSPRTHTYMSNGTFTPSLIAIVDGSQLPAVTGGEVTMSGGVYTLTMTAQPSAGPAPLNVTLTMSEVNGTADSFDIDWGDGTAIAEGVTGLTHTHQYTVDGVYLIKVVPTVDASATPEVTGPTISVGSTYRLDVDVNPKAGTAPLDVTLSMNESEQTARSSKGSK